MNKIRAVVAVVFVGMCFMIAGLSARVNELERRMDDLNHQFGIVRMPLIKAAELPAPPPAPAAPPVDPAKEK